MTGSTELLKNQTGLTRKPATIHELLEAMKPQIALAMPKHLTPERMVRLAFTALKTTPALLKCDPQSIMASVMLASQLGLEPGVLGQCYLIPYGTTCTFIPGWKGLLDLVNRAGKATCWTGAVYKGDDFEYQLGTDPFVRHTPRGEDDENLTYVYAIGKIKGGEIPIIEVWPVAKVMKHLKRYNKVGARHYALQGNLEMYARKIALLQVLKYVPQSVELQTAYKADIAAEEGRQRLTVADVKDAIEGTIEFSAPEIAGKLQQENLDAEPPAENQEIDPRIPAAWKALGWTEEQGSKHWNESIFNEEDYLQALDAQVAVNQKRKN
jgi:recombination protein RecT